MELKSILEKRLGVCRIKGKEWIFKTCPLCGNDRWNFQVCQVYDNWKCWACDKGGRLGPLLRSWGVFDYEKVTLTHVVQKDWIDLSVWKPAMLCKEIADKLWFRYFLDKGLDFDDLKDWNVYVQDNKLLFLFEEAGEIKYWLIRDMKEERWYHPKGWSRSEVCLVKFRDGGNKVVLVEGVVDAIKVYRLGYNVMILAGTLLLDSDIMLIKRGKLDTVFCLDSDVGEDKYERFKSQLGEFKVVDIGSYDDPSDVPDKELKILLEGAKEYNVEFRLRKKLYGTSH